MSAFSCISVSAEELPATPMLPENVPVSALVGGIVAVLVICAVLIAIFKKKR